MNLGFMVINKKTPPAFSALFPKWRLTESCYRIN